MSAGKRLSLAKPGRRGMLYLVVGPSGAGKDTLIAGAQVALAGDPRFAFPRRVITRPREAGGEDHEPASAEAFAAAEAAGAFALAWDAHGQRYGIPRRIEADLAAGRQVIVNVSRAAIAAARRRYGPVRVIVVTAPADVLARRLARRGRETAPEIAERLARIAAAPIEQPDVVEIDNSGSVAEGVGAFLAALGVEEI